MNAGRESFGNNEKKSGELELLENEMEVIDRKRGLSRDFASPTDLLKLERKKN